MSSDVQNKYTVGGASAHEKHEEQEATRIEAANAVVLLEGALAYCSWVEVLVSASALRDKDILR